MSRAHTLSGLFLFITSLAGCATSAGADGATGTSNDALTSGYRKTTLRVAEKAGIAACRADEVDDYFYCPTVDRYKFNGPVTDDALTRMLERRSADAASLSTLADAVLALHERADGQIASVEDTTARGKLAADFAFYENLLRNEPGTRYFTASGYWAPSVNSGLVLVVDDSDNTVLVIEHGDTDG